MSHIFVLKTNQFNEIGVDRSLRLKISLDFDHFS